MSKIERCFIYGALALLAVASFANVRGTRNLGTACAGALRVQQQVMLQTVRRAQELTECVNTLTDHQQALDTFDQNVGRIIVVFARKINDLERLAGEHVSGVEDIVIPLPEKADE